MGAARSDTRVRLDPKSVSKPDYPTRTRIKVCGLTREHDVETACIAGVDTIGFVLYERSPRFVAPARAAELARPLPAFVQPVLLFVNPTNEWFMSACRLVDSALVQFHGDETPERCAELAKLASRRWIKAARIPQKNGSAFDLLEFAAQYKAASAILLDTLVDAYGGSGKTFDWSLVPPSVDSHLVLSGGLTPANVGDGIRAFRTRGRSLSVDVSSGVEASKGIKDPIAIQRFVEAVRSADASAV